MFLSDTTTVGNYIAFDMGKTVTFKLIILVFEDKSKFLNYEVSLLILFDRAIKWRLSTSHLKDGLFLMRGRFTNFTIYY